MKRTLQIITGATAASLLTFTALAQETHPTKAGGKEMSHELTVDSLRAERLGRAAKASDIIGLEVRNYQGEKLGKVDDLALEVEAGRIVQVILSTGGFIGIGDALHAVPPGALHHDVVNRVIHLNVDQETLKAAPRFEMSKWPACCESNQVSEVYRYYGEQPYFNGGPAGATTPGSERTRSIDDANRAAVPYWRTSEYRRHWTPLGIVQKASTLMGTPVKNLQLEKLGKVEDFAVDLSAGRIIAVVVSSGGFLGMGDELSAVPPTALKFNTERDMLQLDATKEALSRAPHFKSSQWPDLAQPTYACGVYRAYGVEPYFTTNTVNAANHAREVRVRGQQGLTAFDHGNSAADRDTTAQVRKEIVAGKGMSMQARNVQIITIDGYVTLRGPVETAEEKRLIGAIAERIAGSSNVDNQIEVKHSASRSSR